MVYDQIVHYNSFGPQIRLDFMYEYYIRGDARHHYYILHAAFVSRQTETQHMQAIANGVRWINLEIFPCHNLLRNILLDFSLTES